MLFAGPRCYGRVSFMFLSLALLGLELGASGQTVLLQDDFDRVAPGGLPRVLAEGGPWTSVSAGSNPGAMSVMEDTGGWFGDSTTNHFLKVQNGVGYQGYRCRPRHHSRRGS